jgi:thiol-disulfide isomerase/thioredoxin
VNSTKRRKHAASPAKYWIAAGLAAIAGFGTVYWSFAPSDNALRSASAPEARPQMPAAGENGAGASPLLGLNTGAMSAFLVRKGPLDLPDFTFMGPDGTEKTQADLKGRVVLLNIWATWCVPCREEMPQLNALQGELGGPDFEVAAINIDKGGPEKALKFLEETKATNLAPYTDPSGKLFSELKAVGMPTTLLLNPEGKEIGRLVGPADWASPEAKRLIEAAIAMANKPAG